MIPFGKNTDALRQSRQLAVNRSDRRPLTLLFLECRLADTALDALAKEITKYAAGTQWAERRVENRAL